MKCFTSEQIGTWRDKTSTNAVDGDLESYIVACDPCYLTKGSKETPAWWKVYLDKIYLVNEVYISRTPNEFGLFSS